MKAIFYLGIIGLITFEIANVYFIMPMPGSQEMESISLAYLLYSTRWIFRFSFALLILIGLKSAFNSKAKWIPVLGIILALAVIYLFNFRFIADHMFLPINHFQMVKNGESKISSNAIVLGIVSNGEAKAYPIRLLTYHHQIRDSIGNKPVMVTYCNVCRSGRVFEPIVNGEIEQFRLVGMDHFNAMFEDATTHSWWRQANGEAIAGELKGKQLPEIASSQMMLSKWLELHPQSEIMQPDPDFINQYEPNNDYELGKSRGALTGTNPQSWELKSQVVGVILGNTAKAYDWNQLKKQRLIRDNIEQTPVLIIVGLDGHSFAAFQGSNLKQASLSGDTIIANGQYYSFDGISLADSVPNLTIIPAYQEYWHSWKTFHPETFKY